MTIESIRSHWKDYDFLVSSETVAAAMTDFFSFCNEEILSLIPNIEFAADAPVVRSVFFTTISLIGEARLTGEKREFDVMGINTISSYRVKVWNQEFVKNTAEIEAAKKLQQDSPEPEKLIYQSAQVKFMHINPNMESIMNYFGDRRDEWLTKVRNTFPLSTVFRAET